MDFSIYKDFPDSIEKEWNGLLDESISHVPFLRYEYLKTWWETRGGGEWPQSELMIITAREQDRLIGIAPLFLAEYEGKKSLLLLGSIEISDYLDLIVRSPDAEAFISGLLTFLDSNSAGRVGSFGFIQYSFRITFPGIASKSCRDACLEGIHKPAAAFAVYPVTR